MITVVNVGLAITVLALIVFWPEWRVSLQTQGYEFDPDPNDLCRCEIMCTFTIPPADPDDVFTLGCTRTPIMVSCGKRGNVADSLAQFSNSLDGCELVNCGDFSGSADPFTECP
jgi:hypothetical protein